MSKSDRTRFIEHMQAGHAAYAAGKKRRAYYLWRRAAVLSPYDEQVWLALLHVLDDPNDRRVCLQNIVAINPSNLEAQFQLNEYSESDRTQRLTVQPLPNNKDQASWLSLLLQIVISILIGILIVVIILLLLNAL
jgi:hypothetical protein